MQLPFYKETVNTFLQLLKNQHWKLTACYVYAQGQKEPRNGAGKKVSSCGLGREL